MKTALIIASTALAFTGLAGCGDDGPPTDASVSDFCGHFESFAADVADAGEEADISVVVKAIKDVHGDMVETGTPEDIPDDARAGWELAMDQIDELDDDATEEEFDAIGEDLSDDEQADSDAFDDYLAETCDLG